MKFLICPDSFKGTLSSHEAAKAIREGLQKSLGNDHKYWIHPIADGGEGTIEAVLASCNGKKHTIEVHNPLGEPHTAHFGIIDDGRTAVLEMAESSGLLLISEEKRNPLLTTTYGVGQMIRAALDQKVQKIILGIGGSATNDGGIGMAQALGVKFLDSSGKEIEFRKQEGYCAQSLEYLTKIDLSGLDPRIADTEIIVCSDVTNPLLGHEGASFVYATQKGAQKKDLPILDGFLAHLAGIVAETAPSLLRMEIIVGGGAAGGLGAGLMTFLGAHIESGLPYLAELTGLTQKIEQCDVVITGEGCMDAQTDFNKGPALIAKIAKKFDKRVYALNGFLAKNPCGFDGVYGTNQLADFDPNSVSKNARSLLLRLSERLGSEFS
ncbi:glycerate kinase [Candidatus Gracilibacteria bacterium]|nr:glycerate kinase [Candidatus Gracilibacteria bacterium]